MDGATKRIVSPVSQWIQILNIPLSHAEHNSYEVIFLKYPGWQLVQLLFAAPLKVEIIQLMYFLPAIF